MWVAVLFSAAILVVWTLSLAGLRSPRFAAFGRRGPGLCTTLGVLGTFTGIFLGLLEFDVTDIDASVPELLAGLKIAFFTSIAGLGAAVSVRLVEPAISPRQETENEATPEAIHETLRQIDKTILRSADKQDDALAEIRNAISADNDSSLTTQLLKLRVSVDDGNRQIVAEFKQFSETMAENNSRALIKALENVVRDFNTQLNEQFGENFKQLNQAVGALLEWQERYRSHVEEMEKRIETTLTSVQDSEVALRAIAESAARIPDAVAELRALLNGLSENVETLQLSLRNHGVATEELKAHLEAVANLKDRSLDAFPTIERNIVLLTETLNNTIDAHTQTINRSAEAMQQQHQDQLRNVQKLIEQEIQTLDRGMEQSLTNALETMTRQLASLSEKFASDYEPLTNKLRRLLDAVDRGLPERRS